MFQASLVVFVRVSGFASFIRKRKQRPVGKCGIEMDNPGRAEVSEGCRERVAAFCR